MAEPLRIEIDDRLALDALHTLAVKAGDLGPAAISALPIESALANLLLVVFRVTIRSPSEHTRRRRACLPREVVPEIWTVA